MLLSGGEQQRLAIARVLLRAAATVAPVVYPSVMKFAETLMQRRNVLNRSSQPLRPHPGKPEALFLDEATSAGSTGD